MMKRAAFLAAIAACAALALNALADKPASASGEAKAKPKVMTIKGEIVDTGCYLGHGAKGEKHKECATKCVAGGMPIGLLAANGKLYLLTPNHDSADAYNQCKDLVASMVEVTGTVMERSGMMGLDVTDVKAADAVAK